LVAITEIIAKKRDGRQLSPEEIAAAVSGFVRGEVSGGQMAALLMAIVLNGMTPRETGDLTLAMLESGERLDLSSIAGIKVDKHSTGGVGDKTTLVVAPLVAALGVPVPKMSGRALGHTGGTVDKLESVPGLKTDLTPSVFCRQVAEVGLAIAAQSDRMVPADKLIYALRDATATVESVPLIASSVMSKKLAVGADAIVLDVKAGRGAFMPDVERARGLAQAMVAIGEHAGKKTVAVVSRMDQPLGAAVGDGPELAEAVATLGGKGPADLAALCEVVAGHMLALGGAVRDPREGRGRARDALSSGVGLAKLQEMIEAQGGTPQVVGDPALLTRGAEPTTVSIAEQGWVLGIDPRAVGLAVRSLKVAAGDHGHACGVLLHKKMGDRVAGDLVATILAPATARSGLELATSRVRRAFRVGPSRPTVPDLIADVVRP
jgi:pyrimidine-nucleoside phosphorylase